MISVGFLALTMWEEDRWAPAKRRLTLPNAGRDSNGAKPGTTVLEL